MEEPFRSGWEESLKSWSVPISTSHLLTEKPAASGPNSYKAFASHVESDIVPSVQGSWSGRDTEVGCALGLLCPGLM